MPVFRIIKPAKLGYPEIVGPHELVMVQSPETEATGTGTGYLQTGFQPPDFERFNRFLKLHVYV